MNKQRRKTINDISNGIRTLQTQIDNLKDEEQDYYDNMPETLQGSDRGESAEEAIDNLQSAYDSLEDAINSLESAAR